MILLFLRRRQRKVRELARLVDAERQLVRQMGQVGRQRVQEAFNSDVALVGCFAGGLLVGRFGKQLWRPIKAIPFISLFKRVRPYLPVGF